MKRSILIAMSMGLLVLACEDPPRTGGGNNGNQSSPDSGQPAPKPDADVIVDSGNTTHNDSGVDGPAPDSGVDFTRDPTCPSSAAWVTTVRGKVTDPQGAPIENAWAQLCLVTADGVAICLQPTDSIADGSFEVLLPVETRCLTEMTMRNLVIGQHRATMYCHLDVDNAQSAHEINQALVLYPTVAATTLPPEGDTAAEKEVVRTVGFADGLEVRFAPRYYYGEYDTLAAAAIDPTGLCFIDDASKVDVLYAFSPDGATGVDFSNDTIRQISVKLPVPSASQASAGDTFDLYVLGGLGCPDPTSALPGQNFIKEGTWAKFGTGTVTAAGDMIESDSSVGLPCLTWMKVEKQ